MTCKKVIGPPGSRLSEGIYQGRAGARVGAGFLGVLGGRVGWVEGEAGLWRSLKTSGLQSAAGLR